MAKTSVILTTFNIGNNFSLAFGYLKSYAHKFKSIEEKTDIQIMDFSQESNNVTQVLYFISMMRPEILGLSCFCWNMEKIENLTCQVKQLYPEIKIILGGPEVGPRAYDYLKENNAVDVVVKGEGEVTFSLLLKYFVSKEGSLKSIKGIAYRSDNRVYDNDEQPLIENLDDIPSPYLTGILTPRDNVTYLETYRGCPYNCAYCYEGKNYPDLRYFSPERTAQELELVLSSDSVNSFSFIDPVFNLDKDKFKGLGNTIIKLNRNNKKMHTIEIMIEKLDNETVDLLKKMNVESIETGPQTVNQDTLKNIKRYFKQDKLIEGIKLLQENDIKVISDLIIGLPGDNIFKFFNSVKFVVNLKPYRLVFSTLHVLPGTYLYSNGDKFGLKFDPKPPHCVLATQSFSFQGVKKAEVFSKSFEKEYHL